MPELRRATPGDADVSVVIAAHNARHTIRATLASVRRQTMTPLEVIVVDDGSSDDTADVVEMLDDDRVRVLRQANGGPAVARNSGAAIARGRYVAFLDSDDLWFPSYLERACAVLESSDDSGFAYTDAYVFNADTGRVRHDMASAVPQPVPVDRDAFLTALIQRNFIFNSATVPVRWLERVGGYDGRRRLAEEWDLWLRLAAAGGAGVWMGQTLAMYREHRGQTSRQVLQMKRAADAVLRELDLDTMPSDSHRALLLRQRALSAREIEIVEGRAGWASRRRRVRDRLLDVRRHAGFDYRWHPVPPAPVADAFGVDLRRVDQT